MAIRFRCPACDRRLSIATRKAGTQTACPNCKVMVTVPGPAPTTEPAEPGPAPPRSRRLMPVAVLAGGVLLLVVGVAVALTVALRKPTAPEQASAEPPAATPAAPEAPPAPPQQAPLAKPPGGLKNN